MLKPYGLKGSMLSILFVIGKQALINQKRLAEVLVLDQSTMSRDLKKLKTRQLVRSKPGADSRSKELTLTTKGYKLIEEISPKWEKLHHQMDNTLGQFNSKQIDILLAAIKSQYLSNPMKA